MDHQTALSSQAVERYTLDELTSPEREEFEDHFFSCPDCSAALREYEVFVMNARAVFKEDAQIRTAAAVQPWWKGFKGWFRIPILAPALAALALAFIMFRNPGTIKPDPLGAQSAWTLIADARDGAVPHHVITPATVWLALAIELTPGMTPNRWVSYHWEVREVGEVGGSDGKLVDQGDDKVNPLQLKIAASKFESGKTYRLTVQGDPATPPIASSFVIDRN